MIIIGAIGLSQGWLGLLGKLLFVGILSLGLTWIILLGGLPLMIIYFLAVPFFFLGYVLFLPVKEARKQDLSPWNSSRGVLDAG